jgi:hypothetical protein
MSIANGDKAKISAREIISLSGGIAGVIDIPYLAFQKDNSYNLSFQQDNIQLFTKPSRGNYAFKLTKHETKHGRQTHHH